MAKLFLVFSGTSYLMQSFFLTSQFFEQLFCKVISQKLNQTELKYIYMEKYIYLYIYMEKSETQFSLRLSNQIYESHI